MKNIRKTIILATLPMLLVGCIGRQPSVEPEEAQRIGRLIYGTASTNISAYEVPTSYEIVIETNETEYEEKDGKVSECLSSYKETTIYSKDDNIYFNEIVTHEQSNKEKTETIEKNWLVLEDEIVSSYYLKSDGEETIYKYGELSYIDFLYSTGHDVFKTQNYNLLRNLTYFMYSEDTPSVLGHHSTAKVTYRTYYGSENENSIEVEEDISIETNDFTNYKGVEDEYSYRKEVHDKKIIVEDFIVSQWNSVDSYESVSKDETIEYQTILEESYNYYDYDSIPTLDKTLWENAKKK